MVTLTIRLKSVAMDVERTTGLACTMALCGPAIFALEFASRPAFAGDETSKSKRSRRQLSEHSVGKAGEEWASPERAARVIDCCAAFAHARFEKIKGLPGHDLHGTATKGLKSRLDEYQTAY